MRCILRSAAIAVVLVGTCGALTAAEKPWAFRTPTRAPLPQVKQAAWVRNPIDAFVLKKLEAGKLRPAPEASRTVLIRRLSFDLTGLPPTPEEIDAYVNDSSHDAYDKLVERLLASPRYGERWATFWLDLVRYAETDGFKADGQRPSAWRYRDYVIRSLNADKPYDRFVREQIAGDELYPDDAEALVATGFLRHYPDEFNAVNLEQRRQEILNDIVDTSGLVFLGLTFGCARCHDHKYDPLKQADYYKLQAFFAAFLPIDAPLISRADRERLESERQAWEERTAGVRQQLAKLEEPFREKFLARRKGRFPKEYQAMYELPAARRTPLQQQIAIMVGKQVDIEPGELAKAMKPDVRKQWQALSAKMAAQTKPHSDSTALAMSEVGPVAPPTRILRRGDWRNPAMEVQPGYPDILDARTPYIPPPGFGQTTGRRSVLAQWLTRADHPLTGRVMVNRLWQHHFGRGLVATPSDFGAQGESPTHPELLDWLACEFVAHGWSLKTMHRLMVTSATYRQISDVGQPKDKAPGSNELLDRMSRRRIEGEAIRDTLLAVAGRLNSRMAGPSAKPEPPSEMTSSWSPSPEVSERSRRSIYVHAKRNLRFPLFSVFDAPDGNEDLSLPQSDHDRAPALYLLNSKLTLDLAGDFAERVRRDTASNPAASIDRAYRLALGRLPDDHEKQAAQRFLDRQTELLRNKKLSPPEASAQALADLCHVLLNVNEFIYVD